MYHCPDPAQGITTARWGLDDPDLDLDLSVIDLDLDLSVI